jgi:hypothetical protein
MSVPMTVSLGASSFFTPVSEPKLFKADARGNLTRLISNTRSTEPVGLSVHLEAGSER